MNPIDKSRTRSRVYRCFCTVVVVIFAILFTFPLYWIVTGSFKTGKEINSTKPIWIPSQWVWDNYERLMSKRSADLFDFSFEVGVKSDKYLISAVEEEIEKDPVVPDEDARAFKEVFDSTDELPTEITDLFENYLESCGVKVRNPFYLKFTPPRVPAAIRWLFNTVFMAVVSMLITCLTAAMAGYALAKKRFYGRTIIFSLIVCAMALPKQVILIPLVREMASLNLYDNIWAVIFPIVGWPFGVFLLKQFAEGIPTEMTEACRIDGANEWRTFTDVMFPMIKPGVGACAIFTFINSWNDYFMQLIMLTSNKNLTISLGIATMQGENATDYGLLMAGSALASVPIIIVFLIFQKYFTKGITMGAVKG